MYKFIDSLLEYFTCQILLGGNICDGVVEPLKAAYDSRRVFQIDF